MRIKTGETVYELMVSLDINNNPVSATTFSSLFYIDGVLTNSIIPNITLVSASAATFSVSWSASTIGHHQYYVKNDITSVVFVSEVYDVRPDIELDVSPTIYVGL